MLWLVGMTGVGKTTVGEKVARVLKTDFVDMDELMERRWGPIPEQWSRYGEPTFRRREALLVTEIVASGRSAVIATGGGTVTDPASVQAMRSSGTVIWLRATAHTLADRVQGHPRPILDEQPLELIESRRATAYASAADDTVETDGKRIADVVEEVVAAWKR
jgi:shikimate kinase